MVNFHIGFGQNTTEIDASVRDEKIEIHRQFMETDIGESSEPLLVNINFNTVVHNMDILGHVTS